MGWIEKLKIESEEYRLIKVLHRIYVWSKYKLRFMKVRAMLIFSFFGLIYFVCSHFILGDLEVIKSILLVFDIEYKEMNAYQISYAASMMDNFLFFFTIGLGISVYSLIKPEESSFERKISYLFPGAAATIGGKKYLRKQINNLAIIAPRTRVTFFIDEHCFTHHLTRLTMSYESKLSNLHNKQPFSNGDVKLSFTLSDDTLKALNKKFEADESWNKSWGKVVKIRTMSSDDLNSWRWHTKGKHLLVSESKGEIFKLEEFTIPPNGQSQLDLITSSWSINDGQAFDTFGVHRYTELLEFYVVNNTKYRANVEFHRVEKSEFEAQGRAAFRDKSFETRIPLEPAGFEKANFKMSDHRIRETYNDFSVDDILLWRIVFEEERKIANKGADAQENSDEAEE